MTPAATAAYLTANLARFDLGAQYLGDEPNAVRRPWHHATARWLLMASWPYEAAAGNQSIPAVYKAIHEHDPGFLADRFYLPATPRDLRLLEKAQLGAFGIESRHPAMDFDVVATSIGYPVLSMSFVKLLTVSGIPARWTQRDHTHPMVLAGGLSYGAPEVLAPVVDCWWLGEAEDEPGNPGVGVVTARIAAQRASGAWRADRVGCYAELAREFPFLYFPRFVAVHYGYQRRPGLPQPSKRVTGYSSTLPGMVLPRRKRFVRDLDAIAALDDPPLLYADPAMGSGDLEVARGCPAWCTFCSLTYRQKPYRQRTVPYLTAYAKRMQDNMGSVRMAPFSPDFPMHTGRKTLVRALLENVSDEVDAPTMRVDDFTADTAFVLLQVHGGMDSVTLGVEGGSQRMRDLVGKGTSDADIRDAVRQGIRAGIRKFKLYMISGLPGEDEGDIVRVLKLAKDLADIREAMNQPTVRIQFSWTPLMVEANTPMQWFAPTVGSRVLGEVWDQFRDLKIDFRLGAKAEANKAAFFQLCQRASRDVGEALLDAMLHADQACWGGVPRTFKDTLEAALRARGFHNGLADCFDERDRDDLFGWEFIDQGVSLELLWRSYAQMREFLEQTDSHTYDLHFDSTYHGNEWLTRCDERCYGAACGCCDGTDLRHRQTYLAATEAPGDTGTLTPVDQHSQRTRLRMRLTRPERYRLVGNDHYRFAVRRAAFRATRELGTAYTIAKRSIRFASDESPQRDRTAGTDYLEFALTGDPDSAGVQTYLDAMGTHLAPWLELGDWIRHHPHAPGLRHDVATHLFELQIDAQPSTVAARLHDWHHSTHIPLTVRAPGGYFAPATEQVNAHDHVAALWAVRDGCALKLRMLIDARPDPYHVYAALMHRPGPHALRHPALRLEAFMPAERAQTDALRPACAGCGLQIHTTILGAPYDPRYCPPCRDTHAGTTITATYAPVGTTEEDTMTEATGPHSAPRYSIEGTDGPDPSNTPIGDLTAALDPADTAATDAQGGTPAQAPNPGDPQIYQVCAGDEATGGDTHR